MTPTELPKTFDPAAVERETYDTWLSESCFTADPAAVGEPYSIVIPPPNVTGALHLGHAINNTLQDILVRQHRMAGFNTVWIPGIDHAGIATQAVVEKQLKEKENKTRHDVGREGLVERIWAWKQQYGDRILSQLQRLGCSCDWARTRFTLDEMCAKAVRETFFKLFRDGLVYRGKRLVNWDTHLQTSISDDEIYHENVKTFLWHIRYKIVSDALPLPPGEGRGEGRMAKDFRAADTSSSSSPHPNPLPEGEGTGARPAFMTVATTRPETLLGDTAVAVHSQDPRWNWAIGLHVELPLTGRLIPIIADDILVDPTFGSGVVKVTPAHDTNDYAVWQRHQNQPDQIDLINLMNPDGTLNAAAGAYAGLTMAAARQKVVEDLGDALVKEEPYETQVGHSDRSKTAIQPYLSDQWFVKMAPLAEPALEVVRDGTIQFFPERHAQQYLSWLGEKRDWPISRQLWWGHRIPVWGGVATENDKWQIEENMPDWSVEAKEEVRRGDVTYGTSDGPGKPWYSWSRGIRRDDGSWYIWTCVSPGRPDAEATLEKFGYTQDPDVLDTWFSSALWPHSTLGWPDLNSADLAKWYPSSVLMTGRDIITLWVARMVMMGIYNMGGDPSSRGIGVSPMNRSEAISPTSTTEDCFALKHEQDAHATVKKHAGIPFPHVSINPTILDGKGERMSKSKGNGVDPVDIIDTHGADALRFTLTTMATETQDVRMPVKKDAQGRNTSDKFDLGRNFATKLWNAARFALTNLESLPLASGSAGGSAADPGQRPGLMEGSLANRWIVSRFNKAVADADAALAVYRFDQYATACYDFFWRDFCDWYLEAIKPAMKAGSVDTAATLAAVLDGTLRLLHPVIPFITERLWWELNRVRPTRGIAGLACLPSERLIKAAWPKPGDADTAAEAEFAQLQQIVTAIRNLRSEHNVDAKKAVPAIAAGPAEALASVAANLQWMQLLASATIATQGASPAEALRAVAGPVELFIHGVTDPAAEAQRKAKQCESLTRQRAALVGRLANPSYASKAPPHLVQQTRDELMAVEGELAKLGGV